MDAKLKQDVIDALFISVSLIMQYVTLGGLIYVRGLPWYLVLGFGTLGYLAFDVMLGTFKRISKRRGMNPVTLTEV